eukprot:126524-Chlamydomonas_euryale.AAC.5
MFFRIGFGAAEAGHSAGVGGGGKGGNPSITSGDTCTGLSGRIIVAWQSDPASTSCQHVVPHSAARTSPHGSGSAA